MTIEAAPANGAPPGLARPARPLTIAIPKGRTIRPVAALLARAGVVAGPDAEGAPARSLADALEDDSRALVRRAHFGGHLLDLLLLKPDDRSEEHTSELQSL